MSENLKPWKICPIHLNSMNFHFVKVFCENWKHQLRLLVTLAQIKPELIKRLPRPMFVKRFFSLLLKKLSVFVFTNEKEFTLKEAYFKTYKLDWNSIGNVSQSEMTSKMRVKISFNFPDVTRPSVKMWKMPIPSLGF